MSSRPFKIARPFQQNPHQRFSKSTISKTSEMPKTIFEHFRLTPFLPSSSETSLLIVPKRGGQPTGNHAGVLMSRLRHAHVGEFVRATQDRESLRGRSSSERVFKRTLRKPPRGALVMNTKTLSHKGNLSEEDINLENLRSCCPSSCCPLNCLQD